MARFDVSVKQESVDSPRCQRQVAHHHKNHKTNASQTKRNYEEEAEIGAFPAL